MIYYFFRRMKVFRVPYTAARTIVIKKPPPIGEPPPTGVPPLVPGSPPGSGGASAKPIVADIKNRITIIRCLRTFFPIIII